MGSLGFQPDAERAWKQIQNLNKEVEKTGEGKELSRFYFVHKKATDNFTLVEKNSVDGWVLFFKKIILGDKELKTSLSDLQSIVGVVKASGRFLERKNEDIGFVSALDQLKCMKKETKEATPLNQKGHTFQVKTGKSPSVQVVNDRIFRPIEEKRALVTEKLEEQGIQNDERLVALLSLSAGCEKLLDKELDSKEVLKELLLDQMTIASENDVELLYRALQQLPDSGPQDTVVNGLTLSNMALIFGDAFIQNSGLEGATVEHENQKIVTDFLKTLPETETQKKLINLLEGAIHLRDKDVGAPREVREKIEQQLKKHGKCLLYGGWQGHHIMYEIEKKGDGYAFRVYNTGAGVRYHEKGIDKYKVKSAACFAIDGISEKELLRGSFLGSLHSLSKLDNEKARDRLYTQLLPLLGGKPEKIPEGIHYLVTEQRSGTCGYRSLQAFLAHSMTESDYRQFKMHFKLYLLDAYQKKLQEAIDTDIPSDADYYLRVQEYTTIKACVEKFANGLARLENRIPATDKNKAEERIVQYNGLLKVLENKILEYEKTHEKATLDARGVKQSNAATSGSKPPELHLSSGASNSITHLRVDKKSSAIIQRIEETSPIHPQDLTEIMQEIYDNFNSTRDIKELQIALDHLFKKFGSFSSLKACLDQTDLNRDLYKASQDMLSHVLGDDKNTTLERHVLSFFLYEIAENMFRKLPQEERVLQDGFPGFLQGINLSLLKHATCRDAFYVSCFHEISERTKGKWCYTVPDIVEKVKHKQKNLYILNEEMKENIMSWWKNLSPEVHKKIRESIAADRKFQAAEIEQLQKKCSEEKIQSEAKQKSLEAKKKEQEEACQKKAKELNVSQYNIEMKITTLLSEQAMYQYRSKESNDIETKLTSLYTLKSDYQAIQTTQRSIEATQLQIASLIQKYHQIPDEVHADTKYWPWEWEDGKISREQQVAFILVRGYGGNGDTTKNTFFDKTRHPQAIPVPECKLPEECTSFLLGPATDIRHGIFAKSIRPTKYSLSLDPMTLQLSSGIVFSKPSDDYPWVYNKYASDFDQSWVNLYKELYVVDKETDTLFSYSSPITREEAKELSSLQQNEMRIESTISYFKEHFTKLREDKAWILLLHSSLFQSNNLLESFSNEQERKVVLESLKELFSKIEKDAEVNKDVAILAEMTWLKSDIQQCLNRAMQEYNFVEEPLCTLDDIQNVLERSTNTMFQKDWPKVFNFLLPSLHNIQQGDPDTRALGYLCLLNMLAKKNPLQGKDDLTIRKNEADLAERYITEYFTQNTEQQKILSQEHFFILSTVFPGLGELQPGAYNDELVSSNGQSKISLSSGEMRSLDPTVFAGFQEVISNGNREVLMQHGITEEEIKLATCQYINGDYRILIKDMEYVLRGKTLYAATDIAGTIHYAKVHAKEYLTTYLQTMQNKELARRYQMRQIDNTLFLCQPGTNEIKYEATLDHTNKAVFYSKAAFNGENLQVVKSSMFAAFESPQCAVFMADSKDDIKRIEFPRYNLHFEMDANGEFLSKEYPGWHIAQDQFLPHLTPATGGIVLEKDGVKKVLLPVLDPISDEKRALNFAFEYNFSIEDLSKGIVECTLDGNSLIPNSTEARYQLARIYLEKGFYDIAENLLFSHAAEITNRKLTKEERDILKKIVLENPSQNTGSRGVRLRMRALYLWQRDLKTDIEKKKDVPAEEIMPLDPIEESILRNWGKTTPQEEKEKRITDEKEKIEGERKRIEDLTVQYLERISHVRPLDKREELLVLKEVLLNCSDAARETLSKRVQELGSSSFTFKKTRFRGELSESVEEKSKATNYMGWNTIERIERQPSPSLFISFGYWKARLKNSFPFDYTKKDIKMRDILPYGQALVAECDRASRLKPIQKNGLLSLLYHLETYPDDHDVKAFAQALLAMVKQGSIQKELHGYKDKYEKESTQNIASLQATDTKQKVLSAVKKEREDLRLLQSVQVSCANDEGVYLKEMGENLFNTTKGAASLEVSEPTVDLFSEDGLEAKNTGLKKAFSQMKEDIEVARESFSKQDKYELKEASLDSQVVVYEIEGKLQEERGALLSAEEKVVRAVQAALSASSETFIAKQRDLPSIEDICFLCAAENHENLLQKQYPELTKEGREVLREAVKNYLIQKQFVQRLENAYEMAQKLDPRDENAVQAFAVALHTERAYKLDDPKVLIYLTIEILSGFSLRKNQVDTISKFGKGDQRIQQMLMGAGKTSVLLPVLSFLFAEPDSLSTVYIPQAQKNAVLQALSKTLGSAFQKHVFHEEFDRALGKDNAYLQGYFDRLEEAKDRGAVFLCVPKQKFAIYSALKEAYFDDDKERVELLSKINAFIEQNERNQIDEVDMLSDPTIIHKFPVGNSSKLDSRRVTAVTKILLELAGDSNFHEGISIDFINKFQERRDVQQKATARAPTKDGYASDIRPVVLEKAVQTLKKQIKGFDAVYREKDKGYIDAFLQNITPYDDEIEKILISKQEKIIKDLKLEDRNLNQLKTLLEVNKGIEERALIQKYIYQLERAEKIRALFPDESDRKLLGQCGKLLSEHLQKTLFKECGAEYGDDPEPGKYVSRSYSAPGSPKESVPSDPYEFLVYSIQNILYHGVPEDAVRKILLQLQKDARREYADGIDLSQTDGYKKIQEILGENHKAYLEQFLREPTDEFIEVLQHQMSGDLGFLEFFISNYVAEQIRVFEESVVTTPQVLFSMSEKSSGYTGTMNAGLFPKDMKVKKEQGTDGKTIFAVHKKIEKGTSSISKEQNIEDIEKRFKKEDVFVFTDSGNWLKEVNIAKWAEQLLEDPRDGIKGIVYPDEHDKWIVLQKGDTGWMKTPLADATLEPHERLTIIPSKFETGTDIKQPSEAKDLLTIRRGMTKRDALQSIFRMRQILQGQQIDFIVAKDVQDDIAALALKSIANLEGTSEDINLFGELLNSSTKEDLLGNIEKIRESIQEAKKNSPKDVVDALDGMLQDLESISDEAFTAWQENSLSKRYLQLLGLFSKNFELSSDVTLWHYFEKNQQRDEKEKNWIAGCQRMQGMVEKPMRVVLCDAQIPYQERKALFNAAKKLFIGQELDNAFKDILDGTMRVGKEQAIQRMKDRTMVYFNDVMKSTEVGDRIKMKIAKELGCSSIEEARQKLDRELPRCIDPNDIEDSIVMGKSDQGEQEVEQEEEQEKELEQEKQIQIETVVSSSHEEVPYRPLTVENRRGGYSIQGLIYKEFSNVAVFLRKYPFATTFFQHDAYSLQFSENLFREKKEGFNTFSGRYLLVRESYGQKEIILVSHEDAAKIKKGILDKEAQLGEGDALMLLSFDGTGYKVPEDAVLDPQVLQRAIVQAKVYTGKIQFTKDEMQLLETMIKESKNPSRTAQELDRMYRSSLSYMEESATRYPGSLIQKTLRRLSEEKD